MPERLSEMHSPLESPRPAVNLDSMVKIEYCTPITLRDGEVYIPKGQAYDTPSMAALR